jgi:hypothetical protein
MSVLLRSVTMASNQAPLILEEAAQAAAMELMRHPLVEVTVVKRGKRLTSYTMESAVREAAQKIAESNEQFRGWDRALDKMQVELKNQTVETVTFCIYR